jgi:hypothetical protein
VVAVAGIAGTPRVAIVLAGGGGSAVAGHMLGGGFDVLAVLGRPHLMTRLIGAAGIRAAGAAAVTVVLAHLSSRPASNDQGLDHDGGHRPVPVAHQRGSLARVVTFARGRNLRFLFALLLDELDQLAGGPGQHGQAVS